MAKSIAIHPTNEGSPSTESRVKAVSILELRGFGMPETLQDYLKRLQSHLGDRDPLKVQAATAKKLE